MIDLGLIDPERPLGAAVSGGADSVALLHLLLRAGLEVHVLHVNHNLRETSADDARFVADLSASLDVPCQILSVNPKGGRGPQDRARVARYAALESAADRAGLSQVATAHTADDQAETVLLRVLRGASTDGLAGVPASRGRFIRPLLDSRRATLRSWLRSEGLVWREDPTNRDTSLDRNWIRHEVLPLLRERRAGVDTALLGVAAHARRDAGALGELADAVCQLAQRDDRGVYLPVDLGAQHPAVASRVLRTVLWSLDVDPSGADIAACLSGHRCGEVTVRRWGDGVVFLRDQVAPPTVPLRPGPVPEWGVRVGTGPGPGWTVRVPSATYHLRSRRPGDRVRTAAGQRKVQDVLTDGKIPRELRDLVPILAGRSGAVATVPFTVPPDDRSGDMTVHLTPLGSGWSREVLWPTM